jgi:thioredoxin 1
MYRNLMIIFFLALLPGSGKAQERNNANSLPAVEFSEKLNHTQNAQLVDVRTPGEFRNGHLKNALNIDWKSDDFTEKAAALDKNKPVFVYCMSGPRSEAAAAKLQAMGFRSIYEMQGGMMKWRNSGLSEVKVSASAGMSLIQYKELLKSGTPVLVDFYAEWCAPCRKMEPYLKKMAAGMQDQVKVVRINADENTELCKALNVDALPVLKLYKNDKLVWDHSGFVTEEEVRKQMVR